MGSMAGQGRAMGSLETVPAAAAWLGQGLTAPGDGHGAVGHGQGEGSFGLGWDREVLAALSPVTGRVRSRSDGVMEGNVMR